LPAYGEVRQVGDAHALFGHKDYWLKFFRIGVYEPERVAAAREGEGPGNHSPLFAPVPKPTIETGVEAMTLAVLSVFDQHAPENAREK
jgi:hypothetical protein